MRRFRFFWIPLAILMFIIFIPLVAFILMTLWNWLMPALFSLGTITFLQALGLLILLKILIGPRFGFPFFRRYAWYGYGYPGRGRHWRSRMYEKWKNMSEEERSRFYHMCGFYPPADKEEPAKDSEAETKQV